MFGYNRTRDDASVASTQVEYFFADDGGGVFMEKPVQSRVFINAYQTPQLFINGMSRNDNKLECTETPTDKRHQ